MTNYKYLVMVNADNNNNKFYEMSDSGSSLTVTYGRVGTPGVKKIYPSYKFDELYRAKTAKGYRDFTDSMVVDKNDSNYKKIENAAVEALVEHLRSIARKTVSANYVSDKVSKEVINKVETLLAEMMKETSVYGFNRKLLTVFTLIPRKMKKVEDFIANSKNDFERIIIRERDLLQVLESQQDDINVTADKDILEANGLVIEEVDVDDIKVIKAQLGESANKFYKAWRVTNKESREKFDSWCKNHKIYTTKLLFHGSRNENWWSIINTGLKIKPTNAVSTGSMFGDGIYFAPKAQKSIGYTSLRGSYWTGGSDNNGYLAIMETAVGKSYNVYSFDSKFYGINANNLDSFCKGAHSVHAHAGSMLRNDEIVIYNDAQCTIKYLVEIR